MFYSQEQYDEAQREALGDGCSNEFQRCYEQSRLERPLRDEHTKAARLHAAGRVVVCASYEVCCPVTDGLIGYDWVVLKHFASREDALAYLGDGEDESCHIYTPEPPQAPAPQIPITDDDIPF
jgi:hypothetical protein